MDPMNELEPLPVLLRRLRSEKRLTLREVSAATDGVISNTYLSQLESGARPAPGPRILTALAQVYEVPPEHLFERAGYVPAPAPSAIDVAFEQVLADRTFQFGTRAPGELNQDAKRIIIELYERATGKTLLPQELGAGDH
jgi:transcriptional regulator with XRE-family HTH domain